MLGTTFDRVVIYEDAYIRGRQPGDITRLISAGIREGMREDRPVVIEAGGNWCEAAGKVLDAIESGELVLLQPDTIEQTIPWLESRYGSRLRETNFDEMEGLSSSGRASRMPGESEPVEVRTHASGRGIHAARAILAGEMILKTWGPQLPKRTRYSMQVEANMHILPDGVIVHGAHSCDPNCRVIVRVGAKELELRALRPIAAGEELTFDYDTFEYEIEHLGGICRCGAAGCRGRVSGYKHLAPDVKVRIGEQVADYLRAMDTEVNVPFGA